MTNDLPLVSVILPTYNRPEYLREAITSAVNQTYTNIEILISDNCSPNNPQTIIDGFQDPRLKFFRQTRNIGAFANVIGTFKRANGKYVASLLDDDAWEEDYLSKMIPLLEENPDVVIAFCDFYIMDKDGVIDLPKTERYSHIFGRKKLSEGLYNPFHELALISKSISPAFASIMRRDAIKWENIPPEVGLIWDTHLAYLFSSTGHSAYYLPCRLTRSRKHSQTITSQGGSNTNLKLSKAEGEVFCCKTYLADEEISSLHPHFERKLAHNLTSLGIALVRKGERRKARQSLWQSLKIFPHCRTIGALVLSFMPNLLSSRS
jgi:glycosyltransferase involved in cell wall biosynthesis